MSAILTSNNSLLYRIKQSHNLSTYIKYLILGNTFSIIGNRLSRDLSSFTTGMQGYGKNFSIKYFTSKSVIIKTDQNK